MNKNKIKIKMRKKIIRTLARAPLGLKCSGGGPSVPVTAAVVVSVCPHDDLSAGPRVCLINPNARASLPLENYFFDTVPVKCNGSFAVYVV